jgi:hypothetical protein
MSGFELLYAVSRCFGAEQGLDGPTGPSSAHRQHALTKCLDLPRDFRRGKKNLTEHIGNPIVHIHPSHGKFILRVQRLSGRQSKAYP